MTLPAGNLAAAVVIAVKIAFLITIRQIRKVRLHLAPTSALV